MAHGLEDEGQSSSSDNHNRLDGSSTGSRRVEGAQHLVERAMNELAINVVGLGVNAVQAPEDAWFLCDMKTVCCCESLPIPFGRGPGNVTGGSSQISDTLQNHCIWEVTCGALQEARNRRSKPIAEFLRVKASCNDGGKDGLLQKLRGNAICKC